MDRLASHLLDIPASGIVKIRDMKLATPGVVGLESGDPDFDMPEHLKTAVREALDENRTHYTPNAGIQDLREAIAWKLVKQNGIKANPDREVMVTTGGMGGLFTTMQAILNAGDEVLVPGPYWTSNMMQVHMSPATGIEVPMSYHSRQGFRLNIDEIQDALSENTKAIVLNTPHNPTGTMFAESDLRAVGDLANDHDFYVISDEAYEDITYDGGHQSIAAMPGMFERTISVFTLSKSYAMPGMRIGYVVAPRDVISQAYKVNLYSANGVNSIAQAAAVAALEGEREFMAPMVAEYRQRRDYIVSRLNSMDGFECPTPRGAFYVFPRMVGIDLSSQEFAEHLISEGKIATTPGSIFGEMGEGFMRFAYSFDLGTITEAMDRVEATLETMDLKEEASVHEPGIEIS